VIQDVSDKLLQQFIACLEQKLGGAAAPGAPEAAAGAASGEVGATASGEPAAEPPGAEVPAAGPPAAGSEAPAPEAAAAARGPLGDGAGPAGADTSTVDSVAGPAVEALDLGATVLPILLRRYWKAALGTVAGLLGLLVVLRLIRRP